MKKVIRYFLLLIGSFQLISCEDWLTVYPQNEQIRDEYWTSKEEVESVLAAGYVYFRDAVQNLIDWGELRGACIYNQYGSDLQIFQVTPDDGICNWASLYKVINMANSVLANAEAVHERDKTFEEAVMKSYLTEAYFLRALSYFYLVRNWRDAPLILDPYETDEIGYEKEKSSENELIDQIKSDITTALATGAAKERFEKDWATKGRATKWALYALMADVCLWSEDYAGAIMNCNEILNASSPFRPAFVKDPSKWYEMYYPGNSNESIFEIQWDQVNYNQSNNLPTLFGSSTPTYLYTERMLQDFIDETDITGINNAVRTIYGSYLPNTAAATDYKNATQGYIWKYTGIGFQEQTRPSNEQDPNFIIYRVADVMLMKAEALILRDDNEEGWQTAIDLINEVRVRSNLPKIEPVLSEIGEADMLQYVLDERKMELAAEGKRWYDLLRFGKRNGFKYRDRFLISEVVEYNNTANPSWIQSVLRDDDALYLPIWSKELENNKLLIQNPYYGIVK
ncbi:MAG: RagB/SusD family nutrient uptake outer membrane protein [Bacteroidales bacterium]|jgi:hypothetical protein|nr:RagB/SusD family nutrient uptake outer membrane protein [Bacteroidales bacterium]